MRRIVIADNGFVWVGDRAERDGYIVLTDALNIRRYGTTKGLGQLALEGPTKDTILDKVGEVLIPRARVLAEYVVKVKGL